MEEVKIQKGILSFRHKLKRGETFKISKSSKFYSINIYKKPQLLKGIASQCSDGKEILFLDYDNCVRWLVEEEYQRLQKEYNLPPGYLFSTKEEIVDGQKVGNYHVISLIKLFPKQIFEIMSKTHIDLNYTSMPLRRVFRGWVLRISSKRRKDRPKFVDLIGDIKNLDKEISMPHLKFLKKIYALPDIKYAKRDKLSKVFLQIYEAS
jgi:hypothetical protein